MSPRSGHRKTTLSAQEIASTIAGVEKKLDLDSDNWAIGDMHLWPVYRMEIRRLLFVGKAGSVTPAARPRIGPAFRLTSVNTDEAKRSHRVWLVSDGISFTRIDAADFERFCGPLHHGCTALGVSAVVIDRSSQAPRSCREPTRWWAPLTQRAKLSGAIQAYVSPDRRHKRLIAEIDVAARALGIDLPAMSSRKLDAMCRAVLSLATTVERRMRSEGVSAVFVVSYYDVGGYAYVLAAARAGLPSVDVQHGVTGSLHMAYAEWNVQPLQGLRLLPRCFWTWTSADARVIDAWAHKAQHRTVVGGHPFLEFWRRGEIKLDASMTHMLDDMLQRSLSPSRVLVTLQPNLTSREALAPLLEAWHGRPDVSWWLRLHPMSFGDKEAIEALLREYEVPCWEIDAPTVLPLPAVLGQATMHVTHSSSAVIEAELFGVPSIVWSDYGAELFADAIRRGNAHIAADGIELICLLRALRSTESLHTPSPANEGTIATALKLILEEAA